MHITLEQWYKHSSYSEDLAKLLANPVMETALQVAFDKGYDPIPALANPGGNLIDYIAMQGAIREGYRLAFENLRALTRPKTKIMQPTPKAWQNTQAPTTSAKS